MRRAIDQFGDVKMTPSSSAGRERHQLRNIHTVATLIARCALARRESRGGHYRTDYPNPFPEFQKHSLIKRDDVVVSFVD